MTIHDWDLWPWMIADGAAGELGVRMYRLQRSVDAMARHIGTALLPAFRRLNVTGLEANEAFGALARAMAKR